MKEITRVHIAKTAYDIEIEAKKELEQYLRAIENAMKAESETMQEIEARMVELLAERGVSDGGVVSLADVAALRQQMGEPGEFSETGEEAENDESESAEKSTKRLMRDTDNAILGGVCAGVGTYFGINPIWIRLLAIISPFISFGTALVIYIIMWIIVPPAKTAADKLQMRGEAVTFESLKEFSENKHDKPVRNRAVMKVLRGLLGVMFVVVAFGALVATLVGGTAGVIMVSWMGGFLTQPWAIGLLVSLVVGGIALVGLSALLSHAAFSWRIKRPVTAAMIAMLILGALSISGAALFGFQSTEMIARDEKRLSRTMKIELPDNLEGAKYARVVGHQAGTVIDSRDSEIRAELTYYEIDGIEKPKVKVSREGDVLVVEVIRSISDDCNGHWLNSSAKCLFGDNVRVDFYGPIDYEAAKYPEENLPKEDVIDYL